MTFVLRLKTQPCILVLSCTSVTNVGSTKTRRKVTSENGCRQASMSKSYFNDIFPYFSQALFSLEVAYPRHYRLLAIFTRSWLWNQMLFAGICDKYMQHMGWNKIEYQTKCMTNQLTQCHQTFQNGQWWGLMWCVCSPSCCSEIEKE